MVTVPCLIAVSVLRPSANSYDFTCLVPYKADLSSSSGHFLILKPASYSLMLLALALASATSAAQEHPLFKSDAVLKAVLTAPIAQTYEQRHRDVRLYYPGQWTYVDDDGETKRLDVSIRTRGRFRRSYCVLPPLQLNFKKSQVEGTLFTGQDKLKLVAPCKDDTRHQQYVVLEYLAYRTFEIITEYGFRTRLVRLSYVDRDDNLEPWTDLTFVIEDDADMARRLGLERLRLPSIKYKELDHPKAALVQLFQFLIANNDYSLLKPTIDDDCCHNIDVLGVEDSEDGRVPIPFDFDMSGMVNAGYAAPPRQVPVRDVRQRYFYGLCLPPEILSDAISHFQSKRDEIFSLYANSAELDDKNKEKSLKYIQEFYDILDSPQQTNREIIDRCRGRNLMEQMLEAEAATE